MNTEKIELKTDDAPPAIGPYSQAIKVGDVIFVSGQIAINPKTGNIDSDNIKEQTEQVLKNIENILKASGKTLNNVLKTTVYLKDMNDFAAFNEVYSSFFEKPFPSRATVEVNRLPKDALIEIECIASNK